MGHRMAQETMHRRQTLRIAMHGSPSFSYTTFISPAFYAQMSTQDHMLEQKVEMDRRNEWQRLRVYKRFEG